MKRIEEGIGLLLRRRKATLSVAESCTGGWVAHRITNISGSSDYFESGVVSYSNHAKESLLGVSPSIINQNGPVSEPVARGMAEGIRRKRGTTFGLATTGLAGPLGGTPEVPVGTVFIALACPEETVVRRFRFLGTRIQIKRLATEKALEMLVERLSSNTSGFVGYGRSE
jgi:PncC family amidohydrolase